MYGVATAVLAATMLPYAIGYAIVGARPALGWFSGFTFNVADNCVYLAWMRQAADGDVFQRNLFTTESQHGWQVNVFFFGLGTLSRVTGLPLALAYHLARLAMGFVLLRTVWWLLNLLLVPERARRAAFLLVCVAAGLGWLPGLWTRSIDGPVDIWQPESVTFLALYLFPLFALALTLMVGMIGWLWIAERDRSIRPAVYAGFCGLLLGNVHTYDVVTVAAIWGSYLVVRAVLERRIDRHGWARALVAAALTSVSTVYTAYVISTEPVFWQRMTVPTASPSLGWYLLGYGLVLALAVPGAFVGSSHEVFRQRTPGPRVLQDSRVLLVVWAVVNLAIAYLPVPFQRKLVMGEHIALAMLAGAGVWWLTELAGAVRIVDVGARRLGYRALLVVAALVPLTNVRSLARDIDDLTVNRGPVRRFLYAGEVAALRWIRQHGEPGTSIQPLPWVVSGADGRAAFFDYSIACFAPALTGHPVNAGHWGETPDFMTRMMRWAQLTEPSTTSTQGAALLRESGVRYVVFSQKRDEAGKSAADRARLAMFRERRLPWLRLVPEASNADADVYEVTLGP